MSACHTPCGSCPWRRASKGGSVIPGFDIEKARNLSNTVGPGDDFRPIMACHFSEEGEETACIGYVAVEGYTNLSVRMAAIQGRVDIGAIMVACEDVDLYGSFEEMLDALERAEVSAPIAKL